MAASVSVHKVDRRRIVRLIGGLDAAGVQRELNERYDSALALEKSPSPEQLPTLGVTAWRPFGGEEHLINPQTIYLLQRACREGDYDLFREYSAACHVPGRAVTLRDLMDFAPTRQPVIMKFLEKLLSVMVRSAMPGSVRMGRKSPS